MVAVAEPSATSVSVSSRLLMPSRYVAGPLNVRRAGPPAIVRNRRTCPFRRSVPPAVSKSVFVSSAVSWWAPPSRRSAARNRACPRPSSRHFASISMPLAVIPAMIGHGTRRAVAGW